MLCKQTIGQILSAASHACPTREAITDSGNRITYEALERLTDRLAGNFLTLGIRRGSHVGLWAGDSGKFLLHLCALWKIGAVAVPLCIGYSGEDLSHALQAAAVEHLLWDDTVPMPPVEVSGICLHVMAAVSQMEQGQDLCGEAALREAKQAVRPEDPDTILFTSGTTGATKPVLTTHFSRVNVAIAQARALDTVPEDRFCSVLPMYHCFSITATVLAALISGACVCIPADRHTSTILAAIQRERCTILTAVPTLFSGLLRRMDSESYDISSLRAGLIGGSPCSPGLFEAICGKMQFTLLPSLGQTEATAGITAGSLTDPLELRSRSLGRFFPHVESAIFLPGTQTPAEPGQTGEICIRGYSVMREYFGQPEATAQVLDEEGWLHTGDLGSMEGDVLIFRGRLKELIIRSGENIAPVEIEEILLRDTRVTAAKVIGLPHDHYGEEVCACVTAPEITDPEEIREMVRRCAAAYKVPRYVLMLDSMPLTRSGKINALELKERAKDRFLHSA